MDASVTSVRTLRRSPCLVIWYDMRFGHKTILGDQDFVPGLARYRVDRVLPADVRNLLVNRGTLLVINDMLLERGDLGEAERRTVVKHAVKAVIGYGDALLYFHGRYDWSHQEKQRRMAATRDVDPAFRALYDECMEFRFKPDYPRYLAQDLGAWMDELRAMVQPVHLACERLRLGEPDLEWADYADHAFAHAVFQDPFSARAWARKAKGFLKGAASPAWLPGVARLGLRVSRPRGVFPVLFPLIAYDLDAARFRTLARDVLGAGAEDAGSLRRAYLKQWGVFGDENFPAVLRKLGIDLDARARAEVLA
jgi:hypothetical protein